MVYSIPKHSQWCPQCNKIYSTHQHLTNNWTQINIKNPDISAIDLTTKIGNIQIINIYNDCCNNNVLKAITTYMKDNPPARSATTQMHYIWLGNLN